MMKRVRDRVSRIVAAVKRKEPSHMLIRKHDRWIAELANQLNIDSMHTSSGINLTMLAAAEDLQGWLQDSRDYHFNQKYDWISLADDFNRSYAATGPNLASYLGDAYREIGAELNELLKLVRRADRRGPYPEIESAKAELAKKVTDFERLQSTNETFVAAWRDLVAACKDQSHSFEDLSFRRDTLWVIADRRDLPMGSLGFSSEIHSIVTDEPYSIAQAHARLNGSGPVDFRTIEFDKESTLAPDDRMELCERVLIELPRRGYCVVWLRFDNACLPEREVNYGPVTFYWASYLNAHVGAEPWWEHNANWKIVPYEMLMPVRYRFDREGDEPDVVRSTTVTYARVDLGIVPVNRAEKMARDIAVAIIDANHPIQDSWKLFRSSIVVVNGHRGPDGWGPDFRRSPYMKANDHMGIALRTTATSAHAVGAQSLAPLAEALKLRKALNDANRDEDVVTIMASVRALEHINSWSSGGKDQWFRFADGYLARSFARIGMAERLGNAIDSALRGVPDPRPSKSDSADLREIKRVLSKSVWPSQELVDVAGSIEYLPRLAVVYADHPLGRLLRDLSESFKDGKALQKALDWYAEVFSVQLKRLQRLRNAAIHGGPISDLSCRSVSGFAFNIGHQVINQAVEAVFQNVDLSEHFNNLRDDQEERYKDIGEKNDFPRLFVEYAEPPLPDF